MPTSTDRRQVTKARLAELEEQARELEARTVDLHTICQVGKSLSGNDPILIARVLAAAMADRVGARRATVLLVHDAEGGLRPACTVGHPHAPIADLVWVPREGLLWQMVLAGDPFRVVSLEGAPLYARDVEMAALEPVAGACWVPVRARDHLIGVVTLDEAPEDEAGIRFLELLAAQGAVALENARLYAELQASREALRQQVSKLAMFWDVGRAINLIDDRTRLLKEILGRAADIAGAERGSIMLFDEATDELVLHVVRGIDVVTEERILSGAVATRRLKRGEGIAGEVAATGEPRIVNQVAGSSGFVDAGASHVSSILCVPLQLHADVIGVLNITNKKDGRGFTADDLEIVRHVADQAAAAIHNARLFELAVTDGLTRVFIRRHLFQRLNEELRRARRYGHPLAVLMADIDHFKRINDQHGHPGGDQVLVDVARAFRQCTRETDIVGRYGGEEFCLVFPETDAAGALCVAERVRQQVEETPVRWGTADIGVTLSGGVACFPEHGNTVEALIRAADAALYRAKAGGRNRIARAEPCEPCDAPERGAPDDAPA